jgi:ATP-binding cassette subfamily F protein 3
MQDRVTALEQQIGRAEDEIARLETALQNFVSADETQRQSQELEKEKANHSALLQEWEEVSETLQTAE